MVQKVLLLLKVKSEDIAAFNNLRTADNYMAAMKDDDPSLLESDFELEDLDYYEIEDQQR